MDFGDNAIVIDPEEAQEQLAEYRTIKAPNEEERAIIAGLLCAAAGKQLINLRAVIGAGGTFENGMPKMAVMDADSMWCYCGRTNGGRVVFSRHPRIDGRMSKGIFSLPGVLPEQQLHGWDVNTTNSFRLRSQVPIVPPKHRPSRWNAANFAVLWEVDEWAHAPVPPGDPALLSHVTGDLYAVEAVWDLTPLERSVLGTRGIG